MLSSLRKAFALLDVFTLDTPEWGVGELSEKLRMPKPSVHHVLATLVEAGWMAQDPKTKRYRLGLRLWEKGWLAVNQLGLRELARPFVEALAERSGESVHVAILDAVDPGYVVYIDKMESAHPVRAYSMIGGRAPSYCVATGKAILAFNPDIVKRVLARKLHAHTEFTITEPSRLIQELRVTERRGFSINHGEYRADVKGVAAPIRDHEGRIFSAVGTSGPSYRFAAKVIQKMAPIVVATARQISTEMGFMGRAIWAEPGPRVRRPHAAPSVAR
jgi:DNA-binding IclR family transcriptional regulator